MRQISLVKILDNPLRSLFRIKFLFTFKYTDTVGDSSLEGSIVLRKEERKREKEIKSFMVDLRSGWSDVCLYWKVLVPLINLRKFWWKRLGFVLRYVTFCL